MPLVKPPKPVIAERRYFARVEKPLALTIERYTASLGTDNLNHVGRQALRFTSKRNAQFTPRLEQRPTSGPTARSNRCRHLPTQDQGTTTGLPFIKECLNA